MHPQHRAAGAPIAALQNRAAGALGAVKGVQDVELLASPAESPCQAVLADEVEELRMLCAEWLPFTGLLLAAPHLRGARLACRAL